MTLTKAIEELYYWQYSYTNSFHNKLFDLFQKADCNNKEKLATVFPEENMALELWNNADESGDALFKQYELIKNKD